MPHPDDYTVGWICAIQTEYVAARAFLDEEHERPTTVSPNDNNAYTLGKIWGHNVVIAVLPDGEYGISSAASVARDMMHSFCNVRVGLMVGIGGGAPSKRHDIRLGDVVVSAPRDGKGGVFQYDFGKTIQDQSFKPTGFLNQPPVVLRTAVTVLSGQYESDGHGLEDNISNILQKKKRLQKMYSRPDPNSDRLYRPEVVHPGDCDSCSAACGTDLSTIVRRHKRTEDEDIPAVHYGIIASGNQLMKDASVRDKLAAEENILCFEMEAAGLMNHFPCLVIRGICDYSDSHKNKEWQGYAAMTAAAYAKDLLRRIAPNRIEAEKKIREVLSGVQQSIDEVIQVQYDQANKGILDWLTPIEYGPQHSDFFYRRVPGTGQWFLSCDEYQTWLNSKEHTLFCPGIPGSGKTILTAIVVNDLMTRFRNDQTIGIAYIYFNFRQTDDQKIGNLMSSLLKQLTPSHSFPESVKDLYNQHKERQTRPSADEISKALRLVATRYSKVFIILDALDECQPFNDSGLELLSYIFNLQANTATKFFATSRPIPDIEKKFETHLRREILASNEDVRTYLDGHMSKLSACVLNRPDVQEEIKVEITSAVEGMFLLAQLYLDSLKDKTSVTIVRAALKQLKKQSQLGPGEDKKREILEKAYEQAMKRISSQMPGFQMLGMKVLAWITRAKRQLATSELQHALAVKIGSTELDRDNLPEIEDMVSACAGLVTVDKESRIIRLVHYTTQEYFNRARPNWFPDVEEDITEICVTYLSFSAFESGSFLEFRAFKERLRLNPLYDYAAQNWGHHARTAPEKQLIIDFMESEANVTASCQALIAPRNRIRWSRHDEAGGKMTCVHLAAHFGLTCITSLLKNGHDVDARDSKQQTPLWWAVNNRHEAIARLLLENGADVEAKDEVDRTSLLLAVEKGYTTIVQLLLNKDANTEAENNAGQTSLLLAVEKGHDAIVQLLLNKAADTEAEAIFYGTSLCLAVQKGYTTIVQLLLNKDANTEAKRASQTSLSLAVEKGHDAIVQLLLEKGANTEVKGIFNRTLLLLAVDEGRETIVQLLLKSSADVEARDYFGSTPLSLAAERGHEAIAQFLLEKGAVVDAKTDRGETSLWLAARGGHEAIVSLLLTKGAVVDVSTGGETPLWLAARRGHEAIAQLLLEKGAIIDAGTNRGETPLWLAARRGHEAIVSLLLTKGAVVDARTGRGETPLSSAVERGHEAIVRLLLEKGANANANVQVNIYNQTPLHSALIENGHEAIVRLLLKQGADVKANDNKSQTLLHLAAKNGDEAIVQLLLKHGANVEAKDYWRRTPLFLAKRHGHEAIVQLLLGSGARI